MFRKLAVGRDLAAENIENGRTTLGIELQHIVARRRRSQRGAIIIKRAHAGVGPLHVLSRHRLGEIVGGEVQKIVPLLIGDGGLEVRVCVIGVCRAYQGVIRFVGNREDDAAVFALEKVALVVIVELGRHDVGAAHEAHAFQRILAQLAADDVLHPGSRRIHERFCRDLARALGVLDSDGPFICATLCRDDLGARHDGRALRLRIARVQDHKTAVFDPAVGVFIGFLKPGLQRRAFRRPSQLDRGRCGQDLPTAKIVVEEKPKPDQPSGPPPLHPRHNPGQQL